MKKKILILFISLMLLLSVSLTIFIALTGTEKLTTASLWKNLLYNFPVFILMGIFDYYLIRLISKRKKDTEIDALAIFSAVILFPVLWGCTAFFAASVFSYSFSVIRNVLPVIVCNGIITLFICVYIYGRKELETSQQLARIEREKLKYQFEALKNQINPHFLFNSLNVMASLAYQDAGKANHFAKRLAEVYRYVLSTHDKKTVTLCEELAFVDSYLYLEKMRFGNTLQFKIENNDENLDHEIIPVSLQSLVENAIKHNIATSVSPLVITIYVGNNSVTITNNIQLRNNSYKNGIGLDNLRKQYLFYSKHIKIERSCSEFTVQIPYI